MPLPKLEPAFSSLLRLMLTVLMLLTGILLLVTVLKIIMVDSHLSNRNQLDCRRNQAFTLFPRNTLNFKL